MEVDLRSDTVTRPTPGMLDAMLSAKVGDDVFGEDPSINALEEKAAALFGMESALFCPSGTMTNQIALNVLTSPPGQVIVDESSHTYKYEGGGIAFNSGCSVKLLKGDRGRLTADLVESAISPDDLHFPDSQVVSLENTANRGGGALYNFQDILAIRKVCDAHKLSLHLDGARLFNALVETEETAADYGKVFDTISICLSKGLGAPVGSLLLSSREVHYKARRIRKVFGGGMRQAGFLAAAGIYALDHHIDRLKEDHSRAALLAAELTPLPYVSSLLPVETNILAFELIPTVSPAVYLAYLADQGIAAVPFGGQFIRFVTHLDLTDKMIQQLIDAIKGFKA